MTVRSPQTPARARWPAPEYACGVVVRRPRHACWRLLADVSHWPAWTPTVSRVDALDGPALRLGARFRIEQPGLRILDRTVTEIEPGRWFARRARMPGVCMVTGHHLSEPSGTTRLLLAFEVRGALALLVDRRHGSAVRAALNAEAQGFRQYVETAA
jgi:hypothetical protein